MVELIVKDRNRIVPSGLYTLSGESIPMIGVEDLQALGITRIPDHITLVKMENSYAYLVLMNEKQLKKFLKHPNQ